MKPARQSVVLELADVGDPNPYPPRTFAQRLRAMLKTALRRDGLRCRRLADGSKAEITTKANDKET